MKLGNKTKNTGFGAIKVQLPGGEPEEQKVDTPMTQSTQPIVRIAPSENVAAKDPMRYRPDGSRRGLF